MRLIPTRQQWCAWSLPSKLTAIGAYVGFVALLLSAASFLFPPQSIEDSPGAVQAGRDVKIYKGAEPKFEDQLAGILMPGDEPYPPTPCPPDYQPDGVRLYVGSNVFFATDEEFDLVRSRGESIVGIRVDREGAWISAVFYRSDGREIARLEDNRFKINPNSYFLPPERPSKSMLAIRSKGDEFLQVEYINEGAFRFRGRFWVPGVGYFETSDGRLVVGNMSSMGTCLEIDNAVYLFR